MLRPVHWPPHPFSFQHSQQNNKTQQNMMNKSLQEMETRTQPYRNSKTQPGPRVRLSRRIEPIRGDLGASIIGPTNPEREGQNPDTLAPPQTDHGTLPNLRWSFADSHNHIAPGGWGRQTTIRELPVSTEIAGAILHIRRGADDRVRVAEQRAHFRLPGRRCRLRALSNGSL